jgi:cytidylate kinase
VIIAVDGPAASGKGTLAKRLAAHFGLPHLDTGLLYRAVGARVLAEGGDLDDAETAARVAAHLDLADLKDERLRGAAMGEAASRVSVHRKVRALLLDMQRAFAHRPGGAVLDGRDIGTVIAPSATAKLFVTASPEARSDRRYREALARGEDVTYHAVLADIRRRDARDSERAVAPLAAAADAMLLDTSELDINAAFRAALALVEGRRRAVGV